MALVRVLDTRTGTGSGTAAPVPVGGSVTFPVPQAAASLGSWLSAVVLNVTATDATGGGYVSVQRGTSDFNYQAGQTLAATVIAQVWNNNGTLSVTLFDFGAGKVDLIADMTGLFALGAPDGYTPVAPARLLDTRSGIGGSTGSLVPGDPDVLSIEGADNGAIAVRRGHRRRCEPRRSPARPRAATSPHIRTASPRRGPRTSTTAPGRRWPTSRSCRSVRTARSTSRRAASTELIADVVGYFDSAGGSGFVAADPYRDIDTRNGNAGGYCTSAKGALARYGVLTADVVCPAAAFPSTADLGEVTAVAVNQTVTQGTSTGYLTSYPAGTTRPISSDLNWQLVNQSVANFTFAGLGSGDKISFANESPGTVQLIMDVYGYFSAS